MGKFPGVGGAYPRSRSKELYDPTAAAGMKAARRTVPLTSVLSATIPGALDGEIVDVTFTTVANTATTVNHSLKRIPQGYILIGLKKGTAGSSFATTSVPVIYQGGTPTRTTFIFKCNSGTLTGNKVVARIILF